MLNELGHMRRCFQPRQWFVAEGEPDPFVLGDEETFMWVYRKDMDARFEVGYFAPDGAWFADSTHDTREQAVARVNYLNGGKCG